MCEQCESGLLDVKFTVKCPYCTKKEFDIDQEVRFIYDKKLRKGTIEEITKTRSGTSYAIKEEDSEQVVNGEVIGLEEEFGYPVLTESQLVTSLVRLDSFTTSEFIQNIEYIESYFKGSGIYLYWRKDTIWILCVSKANLDMANEILKKVKIVRDKT